MKPLPAPLISSSETQGKIKGARESLNGRKNIYGTKKSKERREEPQDALIFATFASLTAPIALFLNTFNNRSSKEKKRNCCGRDFPISFFFQVWPLETFLPVVLVSRYLL